MKMKSKSAREIDRLFGFLKEFMNEAENDLIKFKEDGNKSAGTRARASCKKLRDYAQHLRKEIQRIKNEEM